MKPNELKNARILLGLSVSEAAEHLGGCTSRAWQMLENGSIKVKPDLIKKIDFLIERRRKIIKEVQDRIFEQSQNTDIVAIFYTTPDGKQSVLDWRFSQSLARTLHFDYGVKLVEFNSKIFTAWLALNGKTDSPETRSEWAALFSDSV